MSDWSVAIPDAPFDWELIPLDGRKRPTVPETGELMTGWQDAPGYDVEGLCALKNAEVSQYLLPPTNLCFGTHKV